MSDSIQSQYRWQQCCKCGGTKNNYKGKINTLKVFFNDLIVKITWTWMIIESVPLLADVLKNFFKC
jgi:hypothetical protein